MRIKRGQSGITLTEMTITVAVAALLTMIALPSIRSFTASLTTGTSAKAMISAAVASARALAARNRTYTGVRFQQAADTNDQYMIFIEKKLENLVSGFCAIEGVKPIKLPDGIGVMDLLIDKDYQVDSQSDLRGHNITDTTTFSIVFSPSGKLVIQEVRVRNSDGVANDTSMDPVFNTKDNVEDGIGMFIQDDYPARGIEPEQSRRCFAIYDKNLFKQLQTDEQYVDFIRQLRESMIYINPHTGTFINR